MVRIINFPYGLKKLFKFHSSMAMVGVLEALDEGEKTKNLLVCRGFKKFFHCLIDDTQQLLPSHGLSSNKHQRLWKKELEQMFRMK
jgi:hypothetical protein